MEEVPLLSHEIPNEERIRILKILLYDRQTPFLRTEIHHVIALYSKASKRSYVEQDIETLYDRIAEDWTRIHKTLHSKAYLTEHIISFHQFLTSMLLADYAAQPFAISPWVSIRADIVKQHRAGARYNQDVYQDCILFPVKQMMLNQDHVEKKLLAISENHSTPGHIQHLIGRKDWPNMTIAIRNDRDLAISLFADEPFYHSLVNGTTLRKILKGIDKIEAKYLAMLGSISSSSHTREESSGQSGGSGFAWKIFAAITGSQGINPGPGSKSVTKTL